MSLRSITVPFWKRGAWCTHIWPPPPPSSEAPSLSLRGASEWICPRTPSPVQVSPSPCPRVHRVDWGGLNHHNPRRSLEWDFDIFIFLQSITQRGPIMWNTNCVFLTTQESKNKNSLKLKRCFSSDFWHFQFPQDLKNGSIMVLFTGIVPKINWTCKLDLTEQDKLIAWWNRIHPSVNDPRRRLEAEEHGVQSGLVGLSWTYYLCFVYVSYVCLVCILYFLWLWCVCVCV